MAKIKVHAANFKNDEISIINGSFYIKTKLLQLTGERVEKNDIVSLDTATESNVKKVGGALGWGVVGATLLGPVGAIAGIILGGNNKDTTFVAELSEGRKFIGTVSTGEYLKVKSNLDVGERIDVCDKLTAPLDIVANNDSDIDIAFDDAVQLSTKTKIFNHDFIMKELGVSEDRAIAIGQQLEMMYLASPPDESGNRTFLI